MHSRGLCVSLLMWSPSFFVRDRIADMTKALMFIDVQRNMLEPPTPVPSAASIRQALQDLLLRARQAVRS